MSYLSMRRQARLLALTEHLRGRRTGTTAGALAERFRVSVRTIHRDLETLKEASLPLLVERGRGGGLSLDRAYTLPPINLSPREAAVLVLLGNYAQKLRLVPFEDTLQSALDKVRGALTTSAQRELLGLLERLHFTGVPTPPVQPTVRAAVERAWFERCPLQLTYLGSNWVERTCTVTIEGVLLERSATFLSTREIATNAERSLRLDKILKAVPRPHQALGR